MRSITICALVLALSGCRSPQLVQRVNFVPASEQLVQEVEYQHASNDARAEYSVEELVQLGLTRSPAISEAGHRIQMLSHRVPQQLSLPDPMVNTTTHLAPVETAAGRQSFGLGVSQKFVDTDRRAVRGAIALEEVVAAKAELIRIEQELAEKIRVACFQLLAAREKIRITQEDFESLAQIEEVVLRQYEVEKSVTQQDVLNVQVEQSKVENQLTVLRQKESSLFARLARLVHLPQGTKFDLTASWEESLAVGELEELIAQALQSRPELESQIAQVRRERRKICLANLQNRPDFTVGLNWIATDSNGISPVANGDDALLLGIGFNLPVYKNRIRAAVCEARESSLASTARLSALRDQVSEEVFDNFYRLESVTETLSLLEEDILPKSERTLDLSIEEYSTGKSDFTEMIGNWRSLLKYRVSVADLKAQKMQLHAELSRLVGRLEPIGLVGAGAHSERLPFEEVPGENREETTPTVPEILR